jgi:hypothetical protein
LVTTSEFTFPSFPFLATNYLAGKVKFSKERKGKDLPLAREGKERGKIYSRKARESYYNT